MRVLVVKTSSLGDVVHTLPALTDAQRALPEIRFDWVVEEAFAEIPSWHPAVDRIIPVALRRWRKTPFSSLRSHEWKQCRQSLASVHYDAVIDAQGLLKSAWLTRRVRAPRYGYDWHSIREPLASLAYHHRVSVAKEQHAVERIRQLFAQVLDYPLPAEVGDYGIDRGRFAAPSTVGLPRILLLHGTTRADKYWPEAHWGELAQRLSAQGLLPTLLWGNQEERERAERIAEAASGAEVMPRMNLASIAGLMAQARAFVAVDTGLGHLGAALALPGLSLYGPTTPLKVGAYGAQQQHLCAPNGVLEQLTVESVWQALEPLLA